MILSAVTYMFILIGGYEVTSCSSLESSMHAYEYFPTRLSRSTLEGDHMP